MLNYQIVSSRKLIAQVIVLRVSTSIGGRRRASTSPLQQPLTVGHSDGRGDMAFICSWNCIYSLPLQIQHGNDKSFIYIWYSDETVHLINYICIRGFPIAHVWLLEGLLVLAGLGLFLLWVAAPLHLPQFSLQCFYSTATGRFGRRLRETLPQ